MRILLALCIIVALQVAISRHPTEAFGSSYEPELQQDGIPVMSAESFAPTIKWRYDERLAGRDADRRAPTRRNSDDLEDDDDEEDYNRAGSSNHDSYENPSFGESRRSARDGDEIENFFDKHLGPPQDDSPSALGDVPASSVSGSSGTGSDPDDQYEAAASSPLAAIFHSIISAHKRPLVITTEEEEDPASSSSKTSPAGQKESSTSNLAKGAYDGSSPIGYLAPMMAAPSSLAEEGYQAQEGDSGGQQDEGVREIIITRRPASFLNQQQAHLEGYAPSSGRLAHQSSNNHWQNAAAGFRMGPADQSDYSRYPVAASYAYQREQQEPAGNEDQTTVSYGLSFGAANADEEPAEEQSAAAEEPAGYPAPMRNSASMLRPYQNQQQLQYQPVAAFRYNPQQQLYQQQQMMQAARQQPFRGARYHKDPSESVAQPVSYAASNSGAQYRPNQQTPAEPSANALWIQRQRLLADLDRQIKSNPHYGQIPDEQHSSNSNKHALRATARRVVVRRPQRLPVSPQHNDLDTYSSYHAEVDPFKSFTASARIVSEPGQPAGSLEGGSQRFATQNNFTHEPGQHQQQQQLNDNLLTGPLAEGDQAQANTAATGSQQDAGQTDKQHLRVRRDDSDDREPEDADDDGVWVDDDEDDDNRQQSSDLNETAQEPEEEPEEAEGGRAGGELLDRRAVSPPGVIGGPHGFELSPDDLTVYHG